MGVSATPTGPRGTTTPRRPRRTRLRRCRCGLLFLLPLLCPPRTSVPRLATSAGERERASRAPRADPLDLQGSWVYSISVWSHKKGARALISANFVSLVKYGVTEVDAMTQIPVEWSSGLAPAPVGDGLGDLVEDLEVSRSAVPEKTTADYDVRLLELAEDKRGKRYLPFRGASDLLLAPSLGFAGYIDGPDTVFFCAGYMATNGGNPLNYHNRLVR